MAEQELPSNAVMHAPRLGKSRISRSTLTKRTQVCIEICCQPAYFALISAINMLARNVERHNFARLHVSCKPWQHFCNETRVTSAVLRCVRWLQGRRASKPVKEDRLQPSACGRRTGMGWQLVGQQMHACRCQPLADACAQRPCRGLRGCHFALHGACKGAGIERQENVQGV